MLAPVQVPIVFVDRVYGASKLGGAEIVMYLRGEICFCRVLCECGVPVKIRILSESAMHGDAHVQIYCWWSYAEPGSCAGPDMGPSLPQACCGSSSRPDRSSDGSFRFLRARLHERLGITRVYLAALCVIQGSVDEER